LFRSTSDSQDRVELVVLLRPTVLPTPEAAAIVAKTDRKNLPGVRRAEAEFRADERNPTGLHPWCRSCCREYGQRWRAANAETVERYRAARRIGLHQLVCQNPECGKTFTARQGNAKTCGKVCRDRARYLRRTARVLR